MTNLKQHLLSRHLNLGLHNPALDNDNNVATFYLWNLSGQMVGYQSYRPDATKEKKNDPREGRYFTYRKSPTVAVWGVESLHLTPKVVFLTEGVFDAARFTNRGVSALAALSNDPNGDVRNWLTMLGRRVVSVCDGDSAGTKLAKFGNETFILPSGDMGDAPEELVTFVLQKYL